MSDVALSYLCSKDAQKQWSEFGGQLEKLSWEQPEKRKWMPSFLHATLINSSAKFKRVIMI